jgi:hypothetical protein
MTAIEFNQKYKEYLEVGHYGAEGFDHPEFLNWLDNKFQAFIKVPDFTFSQIKVKFGQGRFYATLPFEDVKEVENKITEFCKL